MWTLYDELIEQAADDIVAEVQQGDSWTMVKTKKGHLGIAATAPSRTGKKADPAMFEGMSIREAAGLIKSWDFEKATVGVAALNAVINDPDKQPVCENPDAFLRYKDKCMGKKVAVIGHFQYLENRLQGLCDLYVLERRPGAEDYPDPACEYLLPEMDVVFITGCALTNKTMPRLLELSRNAFTIVSGPSTVMSEVMLRHGADALCGFCVTDEAACRDTVSDCAGVFQSGRMVCIEK